MKWMRERDLLIAQTMAFVQSVTGRKPEADVFARPDLPAVTPTRLPDIEAMLAETIASSPKPVSPAPVAKAAPVGPAPAGSLPAASPPVAPQPAAAAPVIATPVAAVPVAAVPVAAELAAPRPAPPTRTATRSEYPNDIQSRVEKFRAHQARINREREAYCSATMAKVHAALDSYPAPRSSK